MATREPFKHDITLPAEFRNDPAVPDVSNSIATPHRRQSVALVCGQDGNPTLVYFTDLVQLETSEGSLPDLPSGHRITSTEPGSKFIIIYEPNRDSTKALNPDITVDAIQTLGFTGRKLKQAAALIDGFVMHLVNNPVQWTIGLSLGKQTQAPAQVSPNVGTSGGGNDPAA